MITKRTAYASVILILAWLFVAAWQVSEHLRVRHSAREALLNRARDISNSLSVVVRSQGRVGTVSQPLLNTALEALMESDELRSLALLDATGEVTASAGEPLDVDVDYLTYSREYWGKESVTFINLVALGSQVKGGGDASLDLVDVNPDQAGPFFGPPDRSKGDGKRGGGRHRKAETDQDDKIRFDKFELRDDWWDRDDGPRGGLGDGRKGEKERNRVMRRGDENDDGAWSFEEAQDMRPRLSRERFDMGDTNNDGLWSPEDDWGPPHLLLPPWMDERQYRRLLNEQGVHWFVLDMSTEIFRGEITRDLRLRAIVLLIGLLASAALGVAWGTMERSARLRIRLARASEMNAHLRDMNVVAGGLAHETKNPLNVVRGLAHMISQQEDTPEDIRDKARDITEEVDRVTNRLGQFMDYSKPLEVSAGPTNLSHVVQDVARVLEMDLEDKSIEFALSGPDLIVEADESLLRQVIFNLLLNALQWAPRGGHIEVAVGEDGPGRGVFGVKDDGPGVPEDALEEIFQPYFTTTEEGTGLGLALVRQIALAHQWDIEYVPDESVGATFRISGLKLV